MSPTVKWAVAAVRVCGLFVGSLAFWQMLGNIVGSLREIDPSYIGYYFSSQLARPFCGICVGGLIYLFSKPIGRLIARGLDSQDHAL